MMNHESDSCHGIFFPSSLFSYELGNLKQYCEKEHGNVLGNVEIRLLDTILVRCPVSLCPWTSISFSAENCCSVLSSDSIFCFPTLNYVLVLFSVHCSSTVLNIELLFSYELCHSALFEVLRVWQFWRSDFKQSSVRLQ